jgi:ADP-ribose pyrophosphatase
MDLTPPLYSLKDTEIIERRLVFAGHYQLVDFHLKHRLYDGHWTPVLSREVLVTEDSAAVLLFDPKRQRVILVEQFRSGHLAHALDHPQNPSHIWSLEVVAGRVAKGESPQEAVRREALEETGLHIERLFEIGVWAPSPGQSSERVHVFLGVVDTDLADARAGIAAESEDIRVLGLDLAVALASLAQMGSLVTATALIWLDRRLRDWPTSEDWQ